MRIIDEIVGFFFKRGCQNININLRYVDREQSIITLEGNVNDLPKEDFDELKECLSKKRQVEVEECYWLLSGDDSFGDELSLIGTMIDSFDFEIMNEHFTLVINRREHKI